MTKVHVGQTLFTEGVRVQGAKEGGHAKVTGPVSKSLKWSFQLFGNLVVISPKNSNFVVKGSDEVSSEVWSEEAPSSCLFKLSKLGAGR